MKHYLIYICLIKLHNYNLFLPNSQIMIYNTKLTDRCLQISWYNNKPTYLYYLPTTLLDQKPNILLQNNLVTRKQFVPSFLTPWYWLLKAYIAQTDKIIIKPLKNTFWFTTFLQLYFCKFIGLKVNWHFINLDKTIKTSYFMKWWHILSTKKTFGDFHTQNIRIFYVLVNMIFFKNLDSFITIIHEILQRAPLRLHKRHFYKIRRILTAIFNVLHPYRRIEGYTLFFKGKLGRKGSVKKSKLFFKKGRVSFTNKTLRVNYKKFLVHTETGVVGCGMSLFF